MDEEGQEDRPPGEIDQEVQGLAQSRPEVSLSIARQ
jgi:hypothetical protein